jgi:hypothetical protein
MGNKEPTGWSTSIQPTWWDKLKAKYKKLVKGQPKKKTFEWQLDLHHCHCHSPEVMAKASELAMAEEAGKTVKQAFSRSYSSFSGIDIKVYLSNERELVYDYKDQATYNEWSKKYVSLPELQAISYKINLHGVGEGEDPVKGTVILVMFDRSHIDTIQQYKHLHLVAANEYGHLCRMSLQDVTWLEASYGVSIDDIVSEERVDYSARRIIPWRPAK